MATTTNDLHNSNTHALKTARTHHQQPHECRACVSHARQRMKTKTYIAKANIKPYTQTYLQRTHRNINRIQWQRWQLSYRHAHSSHTLSLSHCQCVFPSFYSGWLLWLFSTPQYLNVLYNNCSVQLNFVAWRIKSTFFSSSIEFCSIFSPNEKFPARNSSKFHKSIVEPVTRQEFISTS